MRREQEPRRLKSLELHPCVRGKHSNMVDIKERRLFERMETRWPVTIFASDGRLFLGETENISQFDVNMRCQELPLLDQRYYLEIKLPHGRTLHALARIGEIQANGSEKASQLFSVRAEFLYMSEDDARYLGSLIANKHKKEN